MKTYQLTCIKGKKTIQAETLAAAIEAATEMDNELCPNLGVEIWSNEELIATVEDESVIMEDAE
jgi:hypothetical protein